MAAMLTAKSQDPPDGIAAVIECCNQLLALDIVAIDSCWRDDPMLLAERLHPHASGVMNVGGEPANGFARSPGNRCLPKLAGQILDEECRHSIGGLPGSKDDRWKSSWSRRQGLHHD